MASESAGVHPLVAGAITSVSAGLLVAATAFAVAPGHPTSTLAGAVVAFVTAWVLTGVIAYSRA